MDKFPTHCAWVLGLLPFLIVPATAEGEVKPPPHHFSFETPLGTFDRAAAQRGLQVYTQVCASCHALHHLRYEKLADLGYNKAQIKALAAQHEVPGGLDDEGNAIKRPGKPQDYFVRPFPNEKAARAANNGAYPPDQSLIVKARPHGADYIYALLNGYTEPPAGMKLGNGMYYNKYFPGHQIAMPPPLSPNQVTYADGTAATVEQMAHDVTTFLAWTAEPTLEDRKRRGIKVLGFMMLFTLLMYAVMKRTWRSLKQPPADPSPPVTP